MARAILEDAVQPFQIEEMGVRGRLVRLGPALHAVLGGRGYPAAVEGLLAEAVALAAALASALKFDGIFTLQTSSDGPVGMLVADVTGEGAIRGYARVDKERLAAALARPGEAPIPKLLGAGHLAFTVDQGPEMQRYQGITALEGATLSDCAHAHLRQSEQLESAIVLAASHSLGRNEASGAAALMVQRLPPESAPEGPAGERAEDNWRRAVTLTGSITTAELLDPGLAPRDLLYRLYHEDGVRLYRPRPLRHACRCSRERVANTLRSFPKDEITVLATEGVVEVTCEFCGARYEFGGDALEALYAVVS